MITLRRNQKLILGQLGERIAKNYLLDKGYELISQNFHSKFGELDLVLLDKGRLVFVEVETRVGKEFGKPEEAITSYKIRHLIRATQYFQLKNPFLPQSCRIDVVAVQFDEITEKLVYLKHFLNITQ